MESNLRPLTLGEILDRTAQLYRENFLLFAGIFAVYSGVLLVLGLLQIGLSVWLNGSASLLSTKLILGGASLFEALLAFLIAGATVAATSRAVAWVHLGEPATIRGAYQSTLPRLGRYLWLNIIITFFICAPLLVIAVLCGVLIALVPGIFTGQHAPVNPQTIMAFAALGLAALLIIPWAVYAILMSLRYSLAIPACVVENLKARASIRRSIELAKGSWGRIFLLALLVGVIKLGLVGLTQFFVFVAAFKHPGQLPGPGVQALSQVIGFFTNTFLGPIWAAGITLFYYDQRIRKEGYDIEWMMQAAGLTPPGSVLSGESGATAETAINTSENAHDSDVAQVHTVLSPEWTRYHLDDIETAANRGLLLSITGLTFSIMSLVISNPLITVAYLVLFLIGIRYIFKAIRILDEHPECSNQTSARKKANAGRIICWIGVGLILIDAIVHHVHKLGVR
jgi:hypothetical protein